MQRYIISRLVQAVITLLILSLAVFLSVHLTGDPAAYLLPPEGEVREYELLKRQMGLDKPLVVQYGLFLSNVVPGRFWRIPHHGSLSKGAAPSSGSPPPCSWRGLPSC